MLEKAKTKRVVAQVGSCSDAMADQALKDRRPIVERSIRLHTSEKKTSQSNLNFDQDLELRRRFQEREADFLDRVARISDRIRPYSITAVSIAVAAVMIATLLHFVGGWTIADLRFGIYIAAILAAGLLAGVPAAVGAAIASILIVDWAFIPPYFAFKWPGPADQISLAFAGLASLITIYFSHCCRVVLRRLHQRELANETLTSELNHRERNLFSVIQVILQKSLADQPARAGEIMGRLHAIQNSNELLRNPNSKPITIRALLLQEFVAYGPDRLETRGPEIEIKPEAARHLLLLFHELATNAAKHGSLSVTGGQVCVEWGWKDGQRDLALVWKERGGPAVVCPEKSGFGSQLIDICLKALSGTIQLRFLPEGLSCAMTIRLGQ
jgi:two-component sensor histidine kinase